MFNKSPYKVPPEIMKQKLSEKEPKKLWQLMKSILIFQMNDPFTHRRNKIRLLIFFLNKLRFPAAH